MVGVLPLSGGTTLVWSPACFWLLGASGRLASPLWLRAPSFSGGGPCGRQSSPCFPPVVRGTLVLTGRSRHCRITAGLASMDMPLLVSSVESQLWGFCSWFYRASWLAQGVSPGFAYCPTFSVLKRSSCGFSASGFAVCLRDGVTLPGRVCLSPRSERRLFFHLPGVWLESSRWGHPVGSWFVPDLDRNEDLLAHLPLWLVSCLCDGVTHFRIEWLFSAPSIGTKASSIHLSLVASRWGHPAGRVCGFLHSIVTKLSLVSCLVFLQDEVTLPGLDL